MYSRDAKNPTVASMTTTTDVGPGCYDLHKPDFKPKSGMAPFGSTVERNTSTVVSNVVAPGPGAYGTTDLGKGTGGSVNSSRGSLHVKASPAFASKVSRIEAHRNLAKQFQAPGPGQYDHKSTIGPKDRAVGIAKLPKPVGQDDLCDPKSINWVKVATAPSIPALKQSFGYEEGRGGELVQQAPAKTGYSGQSGDIPGPGEYSSKVTVTKKRAAAIDFQKSATTTQNIFVSKDAIANPGPGWYEHQKLGAFGSHLQTESGAKPTSVFQSVTNRSSPVPPGLQHAPGPGQYATGSTFQSRREFVSAHPETFQAFGASTKTSLRTEHTQDLDMPGPGEYDALAKPIGSGAKAPSSSFASGTTRFQSSGNRTSVPGPGGYDFSTYSMANQTKTKAAVSGRFGIFGSTTQRFSQTAPAHNAAPGSYNAICIGDLKPSETRRRDKTTAAFRPPKVPKVKRETEALAAPSPMYNPDYSPRKPTTTSEAFISQAPRFMQGKVAQTPGPGNYDLDAAQSLAQKVYTHNRGLQGSTKAARFPVQAMEKMPGPGSYNVKSNLIKKTFNITIGDSWE